MLSLIWKEKEYLGLGSQKEKGKESHFSVSVCDVEEKDNLNFFVLLLINMSFFLLDPKEFYFFKV